MDARTKGLLAVCLLIGVVGCKKGDLVGTYTGTVQLSERQQMALGMVSQEVRKKVKDSFASTRGTLTLNADGTATESDNHQGGHQWSGTWTNNGSTVDVALSGKGVHFVQQMKPGADGKTLKYSDWTYTKQ